MNYSDEQLVDTLLGRGIGQRLIAEYGSVFGVLQNIDAANITEKQREKLKAAAGIHFSCGRNTKVASPGAAADYCADLKIELQEVLVVLCLNQRNEIVRRVDLYKGSVNASQVRVGELFRMAIILQASAIILLHNHPSGDPQPSPNDVALTRGVVEAGKLLDIELVDHVIVGADGWVSLRERGVGFS